MTKDLFTGIDNTDSEKSTYALFNEAENLLQRMKRNPEHEPKDNLMKLIENLKIIFNNLYKANPQLINNELISILLEFNGSLIRNINIFVDHARLNYEEYHSTLDTVSKFSNFLEILEIENKHYSNPVETERDKEERRISEIIKSDTEA